MTIEQKLDDIFNAAADRVHLFFENHGHKFFMALFLTFGLVCAFCLLAGDELPTNKLADGRLRQEHAGDVLITRIPETGKICYSRAAFKGASSIWCEEDNGK